MSKQIKKFVSKESYKHSCAKDVLYNLLIEAEKENNNELYASVGQIKWRPNYGIFKELVFYNTSTGYYFETSKGLKEGLNGNIENQDEAFIENFDRGYPLFVPDITIFHKGMAIYFIEIINTNDVNDKKLNKIKSFAEREGYYPHIIKVKADDILNINIGDKIKKLKCEIIDL